jgi:Ca2+-binding RTX toxin-like protein
MDAAYTSGVVGHDSLLGADQTVLATMFGGLGDDTFSAGFAPVLAYGGDGKDTMYGGRGADSFYGGLGDDVISGNGANDTLFGDDGNDTLSGGDGDDSLLGSTGDDILYGDAGNNHIDGGAGIDDVYRYVLANVTADPTSLTGDGANRHDPEHRSPGADGQ